MIKSARNEISPPPRKQPRRTSRVAKVDIRRAIEATRSLGLSVGGVEIRPDGTISISTVEAVRAERADLFTEWSDRL